MPFMTCENVTVSLNGKECPHPLRTLAVGAGCRYRPPKKNEQFGSFIAYGPTEFEIHFPVTNFQGFLDIRNSKDKMLKDHTMVVRYLDESGKVVRTTTLNEVRILEVTEEMDDNGQPYERVAATAKRVS